MRILLIFLLLSFSTLAQKFELKYGADTMKYERVQYIFEPMTISCVGTPSRITEIIDSVNRYRNKFMDSLENNRMYNAFTLYREVKDKKNKSYITSEFDVTDEFIKQNNIILNDSAVVFTQLSNNIHDSIINLRKSKGYNDIDDNYSNHEYLEDVKYYIVKFLKKPMMFIDRSGCMDEYLGGIVNIITSVKHYRKSIFSDKIKNLNIAVIKTNKLESFIYLQLTFENYTEVEIIKIN